MKIRGNYKRYICSNIILFILIALLIGFSWILHSEKGIENSIKKELAIEKLDEAVRDNNHIFSLKINDVDGNYIKYSYLDKSNIIKIGIIRIIIFLIIIYIIIIINKKIKTFLGKKSYKKMHEFVRYNEILIEGKKYLSDNKNENLIAINFDIDKFKIINDVYGYKAGDEVLNSIAINIDKYFKDRGIYGRITGDIFIIITKIKSKEDIKDILELIKTKIINVNLKDFNISVNVSIGLCEVEQGEDDIEKIISNADMARIKSKEINNISHVIFDEKLKQEKKKLIELERDLFKSIDNNQLRLYYQPKFNIHTKDIVGAEALIRWEHPTRGMISPMVFIPLAEKTRFINKIGRWVLEEACKIIKKQENEGLDVVPIAINLSRVELYQKDLVDFIEEMLKKYKINPNLIEIEVTETTALKDLKFINKKLSDIKSLGIKIAMDDLGTGNSNLSGLKDICIDVLKLDKSLLNDIEKDLKTQVMVKSILNLSKDLELMTICEGVENTSQVEILKNINAEVVQGYVYSKPLEEEKFNRLIKDKSLYKDK